MKYLLLITLLLSSQAFASGSYNCLFKINPKSVRVQWTGYKLKKKAPVSGIFTQFNVYGKPAKNIAGAIESSSIEINTKQVDSKNKARDMKIAKFFFGAMVKHGIRAKVSSVKGDGHSGTAVLRITMNGMTSNIPMTYAVDGTTVTAKGKFNMLKSFKMVKPLAGINKACRAKHGGEGLTWPDVGLMVTAELNKSCN